MPGDRPGCAPGPRALPAELVGDYLAERGAADIPMPGGLSRADWLTRRPALREPFTAQLGWRNGPAEPLTVVYGPCPRCGGPTSPAALPGLRQPAPATAARWPLDLLRQRPAAAGPATPGRARPGTATTIRRRRKQRQRPAAARVRAPLSGGGPVAGPGVGRPAGR